MIRINSNYQKLQANYLFADIARRVRTFQAEHPGREIIRLGIGDVTRALPPACIAAMHKAADELASEATFRGYGPEQGYDFLRETIAEHDFRARGADISADEIFVSDGAKCDTGNIQELFARMCAWPFPTRSIRCMWTPTSWPGAPARRGTGVIRASPTWTARRPMATCPHCRRRTWT